MRFKKLLVAGVTIPAVVLVGCSSDADDEPNANSSESSTSEGGGGSDAAPELDLEGIPEVVAEVNGAEISRDEFVPVLEQQYEQMAAQSQMTGENPDQEALEKQVVDSLVSTELLNQAAEERGLRASDADIDKMLADLAESNQMPSVEAFLKALKEQGVSEKEVRTQVGVQVQLDQLVAAEGGNFTPTKAEVKDAYAMFAKQQKQAGQKAPPLKDVRPQVKEQVRSQKENAAAATLVETLREDAEITIHL